MIRSHGAKSQMLVSKLHSGTSKTKAGPGGLVRVALFIKSHCATQLFTSVCDFVPCDQIVKSYALINSTHTKQQSSLVHKIIWIGHYNMACCNM